MNQVNLRSYSVNSPSVTLEDLPPFLTIEQAADVLSISRTAGYALANRWLKTAGDEGLPVIRLGRTLRVPRAAIERFENIDATR
jgi:hypothetical protein